jgi:hypothetical protein
VFAGGRGGKLTSHIGCAGDVNECMHAVEKSGILQLRLPHFAGRIALELNDRGQSS